MTTRTIVPIGFGKGAAYYDTHMNKLMNELKPKNAILQGGLVKAQGTPDMTVAYPDMIIAIGQVLKAVAGGNSNALTAALGTAQVETATVVGTIGAAGAGNAAVIITAAGLVGSPKTLNVAVANNDNASVVANKIRTALGADTDIVALFTIGGSVADITLTAKTKLANDSTINLSIDNGTCTGLTAAPTSVNTTAGVADQKKMAILQVAADGTVTIKYGTSVPVAQTPVVPDADSDKAKICAIGPILSTTTTITSTLISNIERDMIR
jgi:hypothetical protein